MKKFYRNKEYKIKKKYRLSFQSENTLNEIWSLRLSKIKVIITSIIVLSALISLISWIIVGTPLKTLLPGYLKSEERNQYIRTSIQLDSLENRIQANNAFINSIESILTDKIDTVKITTKIDTTNQYQIHTDSLIPQSAAESKFIKQYNEEKKFSLSILAPLSAEGIVFTSPAENYVSIENDKNIITIKTLNLSPVSAVYDGTIINITNYISGNTAIIQHTNGFISIYYNLGNIYLNTGDKVKAAQRFATTAKDTKLHPFKFEMWHEGLIVNPQEYIPF